MDGAASGCPARAEPPHTVSRQMVNLHLQMKGGWRDQSTVINSHSCRCFAPVACFPTFPDQPTGGPVSMENEHQVGAIGESVSRHVPPPPPLLPKTSVSFLCWQLRLQLRSRCPPKQPRIGLRKSTDRRSNDHTGCQNRSAPEVQKLVRAGEVVSSWALLLHCSSTASVRSRSAALEMDDCKW
jgi:hypothetical protein